jgi:hypothetical protein
MTSLQTHKIYSRYENTNHKKESTGFLTSQPKQKKTHTQKIYKKTAGNQDLWLKKVKKSYTHFKKKSLL